MRKHRWKMLLLLLFSVTLIGCSEKKDGESSKSEKFQSDYIDISGRDIKVNGGFFSAIHGMSYFTDFKTNTAVPICNKPDCRHLSNYEDAETACNAAKGSNNIFPYKGKLYGMMSDEDGTRLVVSEFDGSNRKEKDYFIDAGCVFHAGVVVGDELYYFYSDVLDAAEEENIQDTKYQRHFNVLNLDSMKQEEIFTEEADFVNVLGVTKDYLIYSLINGDTPLFYKFEYQTKKSEEIVLHNSGYELIYFSPDKSSFYYAGTEKNELDTIYQYHLDTNENEIYLNRSELKEFVGEETGYLSLDGILEEGVVFRLSDYPKQWMFFKEKESGAIRELSLPQNLPAEGAVLSNFICQTEEGVYLNYYTIGETEGDLIEWYGYIRWEDLLSGKNDVEVVLKPSVSSTGNLVDKDGKLIGD